MRYVMPALVAVASVALLALAIASGNFPTAFVIYLLELAMQGVQLALFAGHPALTILAFAGLAVSVIAAARSPGTVRKKWKWLLLPFAMPLLILVYGMIFRSHGPGPAPPWRTQFLYVMLWSHVPVAAILTAVVRRNCLVPLGLSCFQFWLSYGAAVMSYMAINNVWL